MNSKRSNTNSNSRRGGIVNNPQLEAAIVAVAAKRAMPITPESYYRDRRELLRQQVREIQQRRKKAA